MRGRECVWSAVGTSIFHITILVGVLFDSAFLCLLVADLARRKVHRLLHTGCVGSKTMDDKSDEGVAVCAV